jgi:hypothetical protein
LRTSIQSIFTIAVWGHGEKPELNRAIDNFNAGFDRYVFLPIVGTNKLVTPNFVENRGPRGHDPVRPDHLARARPPSDHGRVRWPHRPRGWPGRTMVGGPAVMPRRGGRGAPALRVVGSRFAPDLAAPAGRNPEEAREPSATNSASGTGGSRLPACGDDRGCTRLLSSSCRDSLRQLASAPGQRSRRRG